MSQSQKMMPGAIKYLLLMVLGSGLSILPVIGVLYAGWFVFKGRTLVNGMREEQAQDQGRQYRPFPHWIYTLFLIMNWVILLAAVFNSLVWVVVAMELSTL